MGARIIEEAEAIKASIDQILPLDVRDRLREYGLTLTLGSSSASEFQSVVVDADELAERELLGDMTSLRKKRTGVDNTIFVSTKGPARHGARIKIAIDPPDSFNAACKTASMAIHDFSVTGAYVPPRIVEQAKQFIERNRDVLLDYWEAKFDTEEMLERLRPPPRH